MQTYSFYLLLVLIGISLFQFAILFIIFFRKSLKAPLKDLQQSLENRFRYSDQLLQQYSSQTKDQLIEKLSQHQIAIIQSLADVKTQISENLHEHRKNFDKRHIESLQSLQSSLQKGLELTTEFIGKRVDQLTKETQTSLQKINDQVDKRLNEGFAKTTETFTDVLKRLALIDEAQKKITELSGNVISLQEVLADKRARGAFGEIQLNNLLRNTLPEQHFSLQHSLSNGTRVDCLIELPEPTGNIAIDAKFPLESFRHMTDISRSESERQQAERQFKIDIRKHIQDIATKYIIPGETAEGAILFLPAEAIFAEIHARFPELVDFAHQQRVWLTSPTTMMAILTTAKAVIKDEATRQQVDVLRQHLNMLSKDFNRFQGRMDKLSRHIQQANEDVRDIHTSAQKISSRFHKIERVDLQSTESIQHDSDEES